MTIFICLPCASGEHTSPPDASDLCSCARRTCACYGLRVARAGGEAQLRIGGRDETLYDPRTAPWPEGF